MREFFSIGLIGIPDFLNPFEWLADKLNDLFDDLVEEFNQIFIDPPKPKTGAWEEYLYGNAIGVAGKVSLAICVLVLVVAMFSQRRMLSFVQAILFASFIAAAYPVYFWFCDWLIAAGEDLARLANWYQPKSEELLDLPAIANALGSILGLGTVTFWGGFLVLIFYTYALIIITVKFFGMIALAMAPMGERSRKFLSWMISLGLVTMVFGRAGAVFSVNLGKLGADVLEVGGVHVGNTGFGKSFIITASLILAIIVQGVLIWATHKVTNNVVGRVHSRVFGQVEALNKQKEEMGHGGLNAHLGTKGTVPVHLVHSSESDGSPVQAAAIGLGGAVVMKAIKHVHPVAAMAVGQAARRRNGNTNDEKS